MNIFKILIVFFVFYIPLSAEDKKEVKQEVVADKTLDPLYLQVNWPDIQEKRTPQFRVRKGNLPEQLWKTKTPGFVSAAPITFQNKLVIGTSLGNFHYLSLKTGVIEPNSASAGGALLAWIAIRNDNSIIGMTWVGTTHNYYKDWEYNIKTSYSARKNITSAPIGALEWLAGCIVTRRDNFPIMINLKEEKVVAEYNTKSWSYGEATAPLICTGKDFWLATLKGDIVSFNLTLSVMNSTIKLDKSYATALAYEGNFLYVLTASKEILAYDFTTNTLKWKIKIGGNGVDSMVCEKGRLYVNAGSFYVINCEDGKILLEQNTRAFEKFKRTKPIITGNRIYTCDSEGNIFIISKKDLKFLQAINLEEDVMVGFIFEDGVLYVPTIAGFLYAIDVSYY